MGTPDFANSSLKELIKENYEVVAVFAQPDKLVGRKQILTMPVTKITANENGIPVYQIKSLKTSEAEEIIKELSPDVITVVAYGKILPKNIIDIPKFGCVNVHGSVLPKYRGAAPIQWSIINGDTETGVTTMLINEGLDTGDVLLSEKIKINEDDTSGDLFLKMADVGSKLLVKTLKGLEERSIIPKKQGKCTFFAPELDKSMALVDFKKTAKEINNLVRGLNPWPVAYTKINNKNLKIYKSKVIQNISGIPGQILSLDPFIVACGDDDALELKEVQIEGKKRMDSKAFVRGFKFKEGIILGGEG